MQSTRSATGHLVYARAGSGRQDRLRQPLSLFGLEGVVDPRHQTDERLARPLDDGVVPRELLAQRDAVERRPAHRIHDLLPAAARLAAGRLLHVVAELLDRRGHHPLPRRRRADLLQHLPDEEPLATMSTETRTESGKAPFTEGRPEIGALLGIEGS